MKANLRVARLFAVALTVVCAAKTSLAVEALLTPNAGASRQNAGKFIRVIEALDERFRIRA